MYFKNLDPLRGFLALVVVIFHLNAFSSNQGLLSLPVLPFLNKGSEAVLVFFTLSGYLIIGQLWQEKRDTGKIAIGNFYLRRMLRLYPVYYAVLLVGLVTYYFLFPNLELASTPDCDIGQALLLNIAFLPNVFKHVCDPGSILTILWSIGIEEQFYLVIAPIFALLPSRRSLFTLAAFTILYFVVFHHPTSQILRDYIMVFFFMSAGGTMAITSKLGYQLYGTNRASKWSIYVLFFAIFLTNLFSFEQDALKHGVYLLSFSLLIPTLAHDSDFKGVNRWTVALGKYSFGIYMYHMIIINCVLMVSSKLLAFGLRSELVFAFNWISTIGLTVLTAYLSYTHFEMPFLKLKNRFRGASLGSKLRKAP